MKIVCECVENIAIRGHRIDREEEVCIIENNGSFDLYGEKIRRETVFAHFAHFRTIDGELKMTYSDFEYVLCNHVFRMALLSPGEYSGIRHLIIHNPTFGCHDDLVIMIAVNRDQNIIRVSYPDEQRVFSSYEDALDYIRSKKG